MNKKHSNSLWQFPWKYRESIVIISGMFITSIALDIASNGAPQFVFPYNAIAGLLLIIATFIIFLKRKSPLWSWFGSVPAAVTSIGYFVVVSVIMALVPQNEFSTDPFENVLSSWMYFISYTILLLCLGNATLKRIWPFELNNIGYLLNHLGLYIAILCAGLGAGDIQIVQMQLQEGKPVWYGTSDRFTEIELPFAIELNKFHIEEYLPKIAVIEDSTRDILTVGSKRMIADMDTASPFILNKDTITVISFYPSTQIYSGEYKPVYDYGSAPAAKISINGAEPRWLSCGNFATPATEIPTGSSNSIVMAQPEPKRFYSKVRIYLPSDSVYLEQIEVNKPISIAGWKIYQTSYDQSQGKWSRTSGIELVKDPWLPAVYTGLFMLIVGSFFLIFKKRTSSEND